MKEQRKREPLPYGLKEEQLPFLPGHEADELLLINRDMARILDERGLFHRIRKTRFYGDGTREAVLLLRKSFLLKESVAIDAELCQRLDREIRAIGKLKKTRVTPSN